MEPTERIKLSSADYETAPQFTATGGGWGTIWESNPGLAVKSRSH